MPDSPSRSIPVQVVANPASALEAGAKQVAGDKIARSPVQFADAPVLRKPSWIRVRIPSGNAVQKLKAKLRENRLVTVCEEASCPNIHECFGHRSEEHTSELQSLMRISYAVFCLKKTKKHNHTITNNRQ